jgi:hypothetical protein
MILILFSLFTIANCFPSFKYIYTTSSINEYLLTNNDFSAEITNTGIKLNDYNIKYEALSETRNNYRKLYFDNIKGSEYSISYVKSNIKQNYFKFDIMHEMTSNYTVFLNCMKKVTKYEDNKLYVSMNLEGWEFNKKDNELVFEFSIDTLSNIIGNNTVIFSDYQINFNEFSIADGYDRPIYLSKLNNKFKLYLPYFEHNLYYDFIISYKN